MMDPVETLVSHAQYYWNRLESSTACCESEGSLVASVHIADVPAAAKPQGAVVPLRTQECTDLKILDDYLSDPINASFSFRLISICQKNSWSKLQITKHMLRKLIEHHDVDPSFLEVPLSFYYRKTDEEQSFCVPWTVKEDENAIHIFYTFRYAEYKGHPNEPWVIRQVGVYQKYNVKNKSSLYILLNAVPDSVAHQRVLKSFSSHQTQLKLNPLWLHDVVHASYFMSWRGYISEYEKRLLPISDTTTSTFINEPLRVSYDTLGTVRYFESRFLPLRAILMSFEEVVEGLELLGQDMVTRGWVDEASQRQVVLRINNAKRYAKNFTRTALFLQQRSNNTATLLADTLAFRNQGVAQEQNGSMIILTRSAVFITVITLIYLPWALISGIFGMQFFQMDTVSHRLLTSPQIWIYFVTAVGTTILTVALYYMMAGWPNFRGEQDDEQTKGDYVPRNLQRGYTDTENSQTSCKQGSGWLAKLIKD